MEYRIDTYTPRGGPGTPLQRRRRVRRRRGTPPIFRFALLGAMFSIVLLILRISLPAHLGQTAAHGLVDGDTPSVFEATPTENGSIADSAENHLIAAVEPAIPPAEADGTPDQAYDFSAPVPESSPVEDSYFDDAVFIGDSRTEGMILNTGLSNGTAYVYKGLMVDTVFTKPVVNKDGQKRSVMDALKSTQFSKAYIMLGINETGWVYSQSFQTKYDSIEIPDNLNEVVQGAIAEGMARRRRNRIVKLFKRAGSIAAVFFLCVVTALNLSPTFAAAACEIPLVGDLCRVFLFREYHMEDEIKYIDAKIPQIENTGKTELENRVNLEIQRVMRECLRASEERAKDYYDAFVETGGDPKDFVPVGITIDYETKYISQECVSFVVSQYETRFDAYNCDLYYNIDLDSGRIITLKDWFGPDYRQIVSESMEATIAGWSEEERGILWEDLSIIDLISENTNFYFNQDGQIVVVIEKYAAAYGAAGNLEFTIQPNGSRK